MAKKLGLTPEVSEVVLLWIHESERIYGDRLVSPGDLKKYRALAADLSKKMFGASPLYRSKSPLKALKIAYDSFFNSLKISLFKS